MLESIIETEGFHQGIRRRIWQGGYLSEAEVAPRVAIATTTLYDDSEIGRMRSDLAVQMLGGLNEKGYKIFVADGGSNDEFLGRMRELGIDVSEDEGRTMGEGRRYIMKLARESGADVVAWTESEKVGLVTEFSAFSSPIVEGKADSIVPFRTWKSLDSYPQQQAYSDVAGNLAVNDLMGLYLDLWFGPKFMSRDAARYYIEEYEKLARKLNLPDKHDSTLVPAMIMVHDKLRIGDIPTDYQHPADQTQMEHGKVRYSRMRLARAVEHFDAFMAVAKHLEEKK